MIAIAHNRISLSNRHCFIFISFLFPVFNAAGDSFLAGIDQLSYFRGNHQLIFNTFSLQLEPELLSPLSPTPLHSTPVSARKPPPPSYHQAWTMSQHSQPCFDLRLSGISQMTSQQNESVDLSGLTQMTQSHPVDLSQVTQMTESEPMDLSLKPREKSQQSPPVPAPNIEEEHINMEESFPSPSQLDIPPEDGSPVFHIPQKSARGRKTPSFPTTTPATSAKKSARSPSLSPSTSPARKSVRRSLQMYPRETNSQEEPENMEVE